MAKIKLDPRPRMSKSSPKRNPKVPLTYYRSAPKSAEDKSPFKTKQPPKNHLKKVLSTITNGLIVAILVFGFIYSLLVKPQAYVNLNSQTYHPKSTLSKCY